jgi:hypothetical protein
MGINKGTWVWWLRTFNLIMIFGITVTAWTLFIAPEQRLHEDPIPARPASAADGDAADPTRGLSDHAEIWTTGSVIAWAPPPEPIDVPDVVELPPLIETLFSVTATAPVEADPASPWGVVFVHRVLDGRRQVIAMGDRVEFSDPDGQTHEVVFLAVAMDRLVVRYYDEEILIPIHTDLVSETAGGDQLPTDSPLVLDGPKELHDQREAWRNRLQEGAPGRLFGIGAGSLTGEERTALGYGDEDRGIKVTSVRDGSPAYVAGLERGDVLISFMNDRIRGGIGQVYSLLDTVVPNQVYEITILRDGQRQQRWVYWGE